MSNAKLQENWLRLAELVNRCDTRRGLKALSMVELRELSRLYRRASADLALARARRQWDLVAYLNQLVTKTHGLVYARPPSRTIRPGFFFGVTVPNTFKACRSHWTVSLLILLVGSTVGYLACLSDPKWADVLVSSGLREAIENFLAQQEKGSGEYFAGAAEMFGPGGFSTLLMANNIRVAMYCFALGITFGLGTLLILAMNALMLGASIGIGAYHEQALTVLSIVAPHGVVEISAVVIAGAAGLRLGYALVDPGDLLRRDALILAGRDAGILAIGTIPMFIVAGFIEGMLSPLVFNLPHEDIFRLVFGAVTGVLLYTWLFTGPMLYNRMKGLDETATQTEDVLKGEPNA